MKKTELLAPAGDFEKMKYALHYGADAVYCAGKRFGMRSNAGNFTDEELAAAAECQGAYRGLRHHKLQCRRNTAAAAGSLL